MLGVVINQQNLFGGLTQRQKYDVSGGISDTNTEISIAVKASVHHIHFHRLEFFFLSGPGIKQQTLWVLRNATLRQLYMRIYLFCQSLWSISKSFENTYIPVSVSHVYVNIHFDDSCFIFRKRQWFRLFAVLHKSPLLNVGTNVTSQEVIASCHENTSIAAFKFLTREPEMPGVKLFADTDLIKMRHYLN
jgi:hypothetical protein